MWERFTENSQLVILLAQEEAVQTNSAWVGTEHLLLGLMRKEDAVPALIFHKAGVTLAQLKQEIGDEVRPLSGAKTIEPKLTQGAKRVLELSAREAHLMHYDQIWPEHLLLALLQEKDGPLALMLKRFKADSPAKPKKGDLAASVLLRLGFDLHTMRQRIAEHYVAERPPQK
jgi:ATP-dependent Clp protease ATP-binding subunit ClpC